MESTFADGLLSLRDELTRALVEQNFGISSFEIIDYTSLQATARVILLEQGVIHVTLTARGYKVGHTSIQESTQ